MGLIRLREQVKIYLYDHRKHVFKILGFISPFLFVVGIIILIVSFGFSFLPQQEYWLFQGLLIVLNVLLIRFVINLFFSLQPLVYLKAHLFESILYSVLFINSVISLLSSQSFFLLFFAQLSFPGYVVLMQYYFILFLLIELGKITFLFNLVKLNPAALLALSFLILIFCGAMLLKMPEMTCLKNISWIDALFTSTSACCVTGLTVHDTGTFFTFKGQFVIMILFLVGGINMLTIATFIGSLYHQTGSLYTTGVIKGFLDTDQTSNLQSILRNVVLYALVIQAVGVVVVFLSWGNETVFSGWTDRLFYSVFHTISAFNNAGFSLFIDGLHQSTVRFQYIIHLEIAVLIIIGGLGFLVLQDIFAVESRRDRKRHPWKKLQVNTRVVILMTIVLIIAGTVLFYVFEYNHSLSEHSQTGKIVSAFFQSVTTRTAGFNTIDMTMLGRPAFLLVLVLMFIGASPGSTGGGVKTTTIAVALKAAMANIRGKEHVEFFKRNISWVYVNKTYAVLFFASGFIMVFTLLMVLAEPEFSLSQLFFELISAFGTVGLSMGITSGLSDLGKLLLIVSMFVGRIGFLTLGLALTRKVMYTKYKYPTGRLMIG